MKLFGRIAMIVQLAWGASVWSAAPALSAEVWKYLAKCNRDAAEALEITREIWDSYPCDGKRSPQDCLLHLSKEYLADKNKNPRTWIAPYQLSRACLFVPTATDPIEQVRWSLASVECFNEVLRFLKGRKFVEDLEFQKYVGALSPEEKLTVKSAVDGFPQGEIVVGFMEKKERSLEILNNSNELSFGTAVFSQQRCRNGLEPFLQSHKRRKVSADPALLMRIQETLREAKELASPVLKAKGKSW